MRARAMLIVVVALLAAACRKKPADPVCVAFVEKILHCDSSAPASLRSDPESNCPIDRRGCADIDTGTAAGCSKFLGCLYDGP